MDSRRTDQPRSTVCCTTVLWTIVLLVALCASADAGTVDNTTTGTGSSSTIASYKLEETLLPRKADSKLWTKPYDGKSDGGAVTKGRTGFLSLYEMNAEHITVHIYPPELCHWVMICGNNNTLPPTDVGGCMKVYPLSRYVVQGSRQKRLDRLILKFKRRIAHYDMELTVEDADKPFIGQKSKPEILPDAFGAGLVWIYTSSSHCDARPIVDLNEPSDGKPFFRIESEEKYATLYAEGGTRTYSPLTTPTHMGNKGTCPSPFDFPFFLDNWQLNAEGYTYLVYNFRRSTSPKCAKEKKIKGLDAKNDTVDIIQEIYPKHSFLLEVLPKKCDWVRICLMGQDGKDEEHCLQKTVENTMDLLFLNHIYIPFDSDEARSFVVESDNLHTFRFQFSQADPSGAHNSAANRKKHAMVEFSYPVHREPFIKDYMKPSWNPFAFNNDGPFGSEPKGEARIILVRPPNCAARLVTDKIEPSATGGEQCMHIRQCKSFADVKRS